MINFAIDNAGLEYVEEFEAKFAKFLNVKYCVMVANGTVADTIALGVLKHFYPDKDEVIVPDNTFVAQYNAVKYNNLKATKFVTSKTLCHFPVHLLGKPFKIPALKVPVIEDACEALGSKLNGKYCGTFGDMGTFSFFVTHTLSTGEGGAIVTNNKNYADHARILRNHGEFGGKFKHPYLGWNGKMSGYTAKIGLKNLKNLKRDLTKRHRAYIKMGGKERKGEYIVPHGFPVRTKYRNFDIKWLQLIMGIDARPLFNDPEYLYVPCHQKLTDKQIKYIKDAIKDIEYRE